MTLRDNTERRHVLVRGRVQGVGFRPFVYRIATETGLSGFVGNNAQGVFMEIQGSQLQLEQFQQRFEREIPPLAQVEALEISQMPTVPGENAFTIQMSRQGGAQTADISPDTATCPDCSRELTDPADRRYRYPFINCTNCGPRYSIIQDIPYDRPLTTMAPFTMCPRCQAEYDDPLDRRFHAQPNACPVCGPHIWLTDNKGTQEKAGDAALKAAVRLLQRGSILAIKGLGGFHLACRADTEETVALLRRRKDREAKPLAIMVKDIESAEMLVKLDEKTRQMLTHRSRPILLLPRKDRAGVASSVAPDTEELGIMLPYTPLHELLLQETDLPLVMTSGNPSDEPLSAANDEALQRLDHIADAFLLHNREIEHRIDDSVVMPVEIDGTAEPLPVRRARGFVPEPVILRKTASDQILALGGEMKSTICLLKGNKAILSEHLGELSNPAAFRNFAATTRSFLNLFEGDPQIVAVDMHPGYASTLHAPSLGLPVERVQHHHAHVVSCMAEHDHDGPVIGIAADGTGYGTDGTIWGCEILLCDCTSFSREAHLDTWPLPGGDSAAKQTWRPALGLLQEFFPDVMKQEGHRRFAHLAEDEFQLSRTVAASGRTPRTSSLGRFFDAVAFLAGLSGTNRYEAESAIRLEQAARNGGNHAVPEPIIGEHRETGCLLLDPRPVLELCLKEPRPDSQHISTVFHHYLCQSFAKIALLLREKHGVNTVALSGGCFLNRILLCETHQLLLDQGFEVLVHRRVPPGDGGLSLGQAVIAGSKRNNDIR